MKKNPGRREQRAFAKRNRTRLSDKKKAINERKLLWYSRGKRQEEVA